MCDDWLQNVAIEFAWRCSTITPTWHPAWPTTATEAPVTGLAFDGLGSREGCGTFGGGEFLIAAWAGYAGEREDSRQVQMPE
jgi:hypothetical protein